MTEPHRINNPELDELKRLVDEQQRIAEIGRIVGSALNVKDVYPKFVEQARLLVSADRMVISVFSDDESELVDQYIDGIQVENSFPGSRHPAEKDEIFQQVFVEKRPLVVQDIGADEHKAKSLGKNAIHMAGLKSLLLVPLIWQERAYGILSFRAIDPDAFNSHAVELAQQISNQVAGAIASSNQYSQLERDSKEREQLGEIRKIVGSSLDLGEIFGALASQTRQLVPADRLILTAIDQSGNLIERHMDGMVIKEADDPSLFPVIRAEILKQIRVNRTHFVKTGENYENYVQDTPNELARYTAGLRSLLSISLIWQGEMVGSMTFRSVDPEAYNARVIEIAKRISDQIASAVYASNQFLLLKAEALQREKLAEISRIVSSTLDLDSAFAAFVEAARELVPFDRLVISMVDARAGTIQVTHVAGQKLAQSHESAAILLEDSAVPRPVYEDRRVFVADANVLTEISKAELSDHNRVRISVGLVSAMFVPVVLQGTVVGTLVFRSKQTDPYHDTEIGLATQIAGHIAGIIASSQQRGLLQIESAERRRLADEQTRIAEIGRIVSSALDLNQVFSLVVEEARELVPFDRLAIVLLSEDRKTLIDALVDGPGVMAGVQHEVGYNPLQEIVISSGEPYVSNGDDESKPDSLEFEEHLSELGLRSVLVTPLAWQQEVFGVMSFRSKKIHPYGDHEVRLARQIASQIAGAVATLNQYRLLEASEANYRELVESTHILVWRMDTQGRFVYVNKAFETALGFSFDELTGTRFSEFQPERVREASELRFKDRQLASEAVSGETVYLAKDGPEVRLLYRSMPVLDDGEFAGIRGTALDITAEREAQDEIKIQTAALEEASDAVVILLPDTTIGYANRAFLDQMGYTKAEVIGQPFSIMRSGASADAIYEKIWEQVSQGKVWRGTVFSRRKDGTEFAVDISLNPVFAEDGSISSYISIRRDATERIQAEHDHQARAELDAQNQQLQELNEQREEFFSSVSHELRTPLTAVTAFSDILSRNRGGNLNIEQLDQLGVIRRNSRSLIDLIEDMLDISHLNSRSLRIDRVPVEVDEMIASAVESLEPSLNERGQSLTFSSGTMGVWINADEGRLIQLLSNLITNACKYSPDGEEIEIRTDSDGESIEVRIVDSGYGMSSADLNMLYSPFYRSDRDEIRTQSGTGLGMSISKTLVELHDGTIGVESALNEGTTVTVKLPGVIDR